MTGEHSSTFIIILSQGPQPKKPVTSSAMIHRSMHFHCPQLRHHPNSAVSGIFFTMVIKKLKSNKI